MSIVYERLKQLCDERGISGYKMCKDTGLQPSIMTDLKMDRKHSLSAKSLAKLAAYFEVPMNYIAGDTDDPLVAAANPNLPFDEYPRPNYIENGYVGVGFPTSKGALTITAEDFDELAEIWNTLKDRSEMKILFKSAKGATKGQVEAVAKMLDSFKSTETKGQKEHEWEF